LTDHLLSSMFAGGVVSFLAAPTELVKCRLQHQGTLQAARRHVAEWERSDRKGPRPTTYRGPWDVLREVYLHEGGARACFNGLATTLWRGVLGNLMMFGVYEALKSGLAAWRGLPSTEALGAADLMLAGGCGGTAFWLAVFPIDVVKSKLQVQRHGHEQYHGILDCVRKVHAQEGLAGLYRGFVPCLLRSFPANSVAFLAYEKVYRSLQPAPM
jgi:solute carrier family 25 (mitochondrial carnitine/acylcarnitine transporter), member 20/29